MTTLLPEQGLTPSASSPPRGSVSSPSSPKPTEWLSLRGEFSSGRRALLFALAFALPLLLWSAVSYLPFLWHPLVLVTHAGDERDRKSVV